MSFYIVDHNGRTKGKESGTIIDYSKDEPVEVPKAGDLDHVPGAEKVTKKEVEKAAEEESKKN